MDNGPKSMKKAVAKSNKKVSFANDLVIRSLVKARPVKEKLTFGAFIILADDSPGDLIFGNLHAKGDDRVLRSCMKRSPGM